MIKYIRLLVFPAFLMLVSCSEKETQIPPDVLDREQMVDVLAKIHVAESRIVLMGPPAGNSEFKPRYLQNVLKEENIDTALFNRSFNFYTLHPAMFNEMYEDVIDRISRMQAEN